MCVLWLSDASLWLFRRVELHPHRPPCRLEAAQSRSVCRDAATFEWTVESKPRTTAHPSLKKSISLQTKKNKKQKKARDTLLCNTTLPASRRDKVRCVTERPLFTLPPQKINFRKTHQCFVSEGFSSNPAMTHFIRTE